MGNLQIIKRKFKCFFVKYAIYTLTLTMSIVHIEGSQIIISIMLLSFGSLLFAKVRVLEPG